MPVRVRSRGPKRTRGRVSFSPIYSPSLTSLIVVTESMSRTSIECARLGTLLCIPPLRGRGGRPCRSRMITEHKGGCPGSIPIATEVLEVYFHPQVTTSDMMGHNGQNLWTRSLVFSQSLAQYTKDSRNSPCRQPDGVVLSSMSLSAALGYLYFMCRIGFV